MPWSRGSRLRVMLVVYGIAVWLAVEAARRFSLPDLLSFSGDDLFHELDFWCSAGASMLALAAGLLARPLVLLRHASSMERIAVMAAFAWLLLLFTAVGWSYFLYYALWVAPAHAFAVCFVFLWLRHFLEAGARRTGLDG